MSTTTTPSVEVERERKAEAAASAFLREPFATDGLGPGRDELNLAEFPLSPVTNRYLDGRKTVVFSDQVWDRDRHAFVPRQLAISGSDRYGLPTAKDEDVLLACVQLSSLMDFHSAQVHFSRYELLKLLRWPDEGKYYRRVATSLRRWKGLTIYSDRAFYDHAQKSWVNRDFGVFDNLYLYERDITEGRKAAASSSLVWNEVLFNSFQAGYVKRLDWDLYCRLSDPVAKRLYRLLDKRFYHGDEVVFDLQELAFRKVRLSGNYNTAQIQRALANAIRELEALWELRPLPPQRRYRRKEAGQWQVVFQRKRFSRKAVATDEQQEAQAATLEAELARRGIGPAMAEELVAGQPPEQVQAMLELFDWYNANGQSRGPGFLVESIRNPGRYRLPKGFESSAQRTARRRVENSRKRAVRESSRQKEAERERQENARWRAFMAFYQGLGKEEQKAFEENAVQAADATRRSGYMRAQQSGSLLLKHYRELILLEHFERRYGLKPER